MSAARLLRLFHTVRHLRPVQLYGRVWRRVYRPAADLRPAPAIRPAAAPWVPGAPRVPSMLAADAFRFLNVEGSARSAADWDAPAQPRLWRYNLHYFDDLNADAAESRAVWHASLVRRWLAEIPIGAGTGWEPYPTSLRIVNWVKLALRGGATSAPDVRDSLAVQARWLCNRLEFALLGNHLWANAKALAFAGAFFSGSEADAWLSRAREVLTRELDEQILPDGGHFERSPMYHAIVVEDVLDLINLASATRAFDEPFTARLRERAIAMLRWLRVMTHPDGQIALFNDAAFGIAPDYAGLAAYALRLGLPVDERPLAAVEILRESGYVRLEMDRAVLICDVAPIGPDYQPAHAHADTLTFELSIDARRIIVDSGTSTYDVGAERERQRGTAAHNTVIVGERNSSDVWASFRVARRARAFDLAAGARDGVLWAEGAHDGYRPTGHRRRWVLSPGSLRVDDQLSRHTSNTARAALHLHPDVRVEQTSHGFALAAGARTSVQVAFDGAGDISVEDTTWHPEFGRAQPTRAIRARLAGDRLTTRLAW